ncbi:molybdopterin-dependent oxidoreductase, partial [Chloroflexota bacterium]
MEPGMEVKRSLCVMCSLNCGILVYVKNGKVVKIAGNPDNPVTQGFTCKRVGHAIQWLYHPDQLMYPLKRVGKRGEGKWQRISYEQALDEIAEKLKEIRDKYGAETVATSEGTLRYSEFWMRARFMNLFGSPNNVQPGVICGLNRDTMGAAIAGVRICTKNEPLHYTRCLVVQGCNPKGFRPRVAEELAWIRNREPGRLRLIVIDPRDTGLASEEQDMHLQIRPGTDAALMLSWLYVIINEKLYDKDFVENYTHGFDELTKRVQEYPPEKAAEITGIPAEKIIESARVYATTKPAAIFGGVAADQIGFNATRVEQATAALIAITGNLDVPGGRPLPMFPGMFINGGKPLRDSDMELTDKLSDEQKAKHIGSDRFKLMGYPGYNLWGAEYQKYYGIPAPAMHTLSAHEPTIYRDIINGDPGHVRAFMAWGSNLTIRTA